MLIGCCEREERLIPVWARESQRVVRHAAGSPRRRLRYACEPRATHKAQMPETTLERSVDRSGWRRGQTQTGTDGQTASQSARG